MSCWHTALWLQVASGVLWRQPRHSAAQQLCAAASADATDLGAAGGMYAQIRDSFAVQPQAAA